MPVADRRQAPDRRASPRAGGRRAVDEPMGPAWTIGQLAYQIGMSNDFVISEIRAHEIVASKFGREWRIASSEVRRYLLAKQFPLPESLAS
jgi:excisionase family DNA binding protein